MTLLLWIIEIVLAWFLIGIFATLLGLGYYYHCDPFDPTIETNFTLDVFRFIIVGPFALFLIIIEIQKYAFQVSSTFGWRLPPSKAEIMLKKLES